MPNGLGSFTGGGAITTVQQLQHEPSFWDRKLFGLPMIAVIGVVGVVILLLLFKK